MVLAFTLGGGLEAISAGWARVFESGGHAHGIAMIFSVVVIGSIVDLPFGIYRTFVVEQRFGFNRMTAALFIADLAKHTGGGSSDRHSPALWRSLADGANGRQLVAVCVACMGRVPTCCC